MEEFAALERKLASPRRKTPEEIAMEEFAALERKLGSNPGVAEPLGWQSGMRKALSPPLKRPEVLKNLAAIIKDEIRQRDRGYLSNGDDTK